MGLDGFLSVELVQKLKYEAFMQLRDFLTCVHLAE